MELSLATLRVDRYAVALWLHTENDPPKDEWNAAIDRLIADTKDVPTADMRHLVLTDGAAPSAAQRARMHKELAREKPLRLAVITTVLSNPIKRGVATALSWANPQIRFFQPAQARDALQHLDLADHLDALWPQYSTLQQQLPPIAVIKAVARGAAAPSSTH
jgi:hypothetical protein